MFFEVTPAAVLIAAAVLSVPLLCCFYLGAELARWNRQRKFEREKELREKRRREVRFAIRNHISLRRE